MSEIQATLTRMDGHSGMIGRWITDGKGEILKESYKPKTERAPNDRNNKVSESRQIVHAVQTITEKAQLLVRDVDPSNELIFMRIKTKNDEILVSPGKDFKIIALQDVSLGKKGDSN